ncbi:MAG: matrixin family metalloprotease [Deltaproteobacteria bacterium]|nr:matrixin family metalloprotease [Deltaproteobacteria bacterium]
MRALRLVLVLPALALALLAVAIPARAYVYTTSSDGQILTWPDPAAPVFYANWANIRSLNYSDVFSTFTNALQRWKYSGVSSIGFDYWQGTGSSATPVKTEFDSRNAVFFSSQSTQKLGGSTIGVTYIYSAAGVILEADVEFNDDTFTFTTNPSDSSRFGDQKHVFLENVATHEFGHAFGLSHSAALQSTMVYLEYREQAKLSCDDISAVAALYPVSSFTTGRGSLSGTVLYSGSAVFGAHVLAISKTRGVMVASAITQPNGTYTIPGLEPGDYHLMVEPFQASAPISSLCGGSASGCYYGTVNSPSVCGGSPFKRGFIETGTSGFPQTIAVAAGATTSVADYTVSCSNMPGLASPSTSTAAADLATPLLQNTSSGSAARDVVSAGANTDQYFKLLDVSGDISVKALAYSLYSPVDPHVTILDSSGGTIAGAVSTDDVFQNASTLYVNFDSVASYAAAPAGNYYVKVHNYPAPLSNEYPAGNSSSTQIDPTLFYLLIVTIGDTTALVPSNSAPALPNNARCEAADSFPAFADHGPPGGVATTPAASSSGGGGGGGDSGSSSNGCGLIADVSKDRAGGFRGPGPDALFSAWGVLVVLVAARLWLCFWQRKVALNRFRR